MDWTPTKLSEAAAISPSYASMIISGGRKPPLSTALKIYDATGLRFGLLEGKSGSDIEALRSANDTLRRAAA